MFKHSMLSMAALFALSGCLGGGGGSSSSVSGSANSVSIVKTFSDGAGVARAQEIDPDDGSIANVVIIAPQIANIEAAFNRVATDGSLETFTNESATPLGNGMFLFTGQSTFDGAAVDVRALIDDTDDDNGVFLISNNNFNTGFASGIPLVGTPVGNHTFTGPMSMGPRGVVASQELGSFNLIANFNANSYNFSGTTANNSLAGSGSFDLQAGTFTSESFTATTNGTVRGATVHGLLHGNGATAVSGVFHTNENSPTHAGGFYGRR